MPEKKSTTRAPRRPVAQVFKDLDSSEPSKRMQAIGECGDLASCAGEVLAAAARAQRP